MVAYNDYSYLYPPRPTSADCTPPTGLSILEQKGWIAQIKKNGTSNVIWVKPDRSLITMTRHAMPHRMWSESDTTSRVFQDLPGRGWYVFCAELLHSKVADPALRNINYIHDVLVVDGEYLIGSTFAERQDHLKRLFKPTVKSIDGGHFVIDPNTWLAVNHTANFRTLFDSLRRPEDEGLVFKKLDGKLEYCLAEGRNRRWMRKTRRPTKNYQY